MRYKGIIPPLITPIDTQGIVCEKSVKKLFFSTKKTFDQFGCCSNYLHRQKEPFALYTLPH